MASQQSTVDFLLDQMAGAGALVAKKMFGETGLYCDGKMFAIVADDQLYIKPTDSRTGLDRLATGGAALSASQALVPDRRRTMG